MTRKMYLLLPTLLCGMCGCAAIASGPCQEAVRVRRQASGAVGVQKQMLEEKALGLEKACQEKAKADFDRQQEYESRKLRQERGR